MSEIEELKNLLDVKVKYTESFKIGTSGKSIQKINQDYCQPLYFFPELLCTSPDLDKIIRLESVLIRYAKKKYQNTCENPDIELKDRIDKINGSYMLYVAVLRP